MQEAARVLTPQEERLDLNLTLTTEEGRQKRARIAKMLEGIREIPPRLSIERAVIFTDSFVKTEGLPITLRWGMALEQVMREIPIYITPGELIVGRAGAPGKYGVFYPELEGAFFDQFTEIKPSEKGRPFVIDPEDIKTIQKKILPYWKGKTLLEALYALMPEDTKRFLWKNNNMYSSAFVLHQTATLRHSLQWSLDYEKVLKRGFGGIKKEAEERLASLDVYDPHNNYDKLPFYKGVIAICDGVIAFARRHAELARDMAKSETDAQRKQELLDIAERCEWVPEHPARDFREAIQSQWFAQIASRFEQMHGGVIGNGRIDQYLYPYYEKDKKEGRITDDDVLELLEHLWLNMAQSIRLQPTPDGYLIWEGSAHFEQTTIGGLTREGKDATNDLSYLILDSKIEFPLDFPDLAARIHSKTPDPFLHKICECIKEGTGFPKLFNDEDIIPVLLSKGAILEEARDYTPNGCTEVRLLNRNTYFTGTTWYNVVAMLEMALNDGYVKSNSAQRIGLSTGDPRNFATFDDMWNAFRAQMENAVNHAFRQLYITDTVRPSKLGAPVLSSLHDLCMKEGKDVNVGKIEGGLNLGPQVSVVGFGTVIDSLAAIKKLVYDEKKVTMDELLKALDANFEGKELIRQWCLNAPKYGNGDDYADEIGRQIEEILLGLFDKHINAYGGRPELLYVPITAHVAMGRVISATPNGRKAFTALSEGIAPSQGADTLGPTVTLSSIATTKQTRGIQRAARLLNIKLTPQSVVNEEGTKKLMSLIRAWCDQKHWHIQFSIINRDTLLAAQKNPEKYRNLIVRVAGYSAFFVDLSPQLQDELVARTEHNF